MVWEASADTLTWLTSELAKYETGGALEDKKVIVAAHVPIDNDTHQNTTDQHEILEDALAAGADIRRFICGHVHYDDDNMFNNIRHTQFTSVIDGTTSEDITSPNFCIIEIGDDDVIRIYGASEQASYNN